jgi:hypothetical protein
MAPLSSLDAALVASAFQLRGNDVAIDAVLVEHWNGADADLLNAMQERHGWSAASEYAPNYVACLRQALSSR